MKSIIGSIGVAIVSVGLFVCCGGAAKPTDESNLTQYVDPYIGTAGHGHVFMGANVPFGMVQLGPSNIPQSWDWTSGYHYSDSTIIGFSHMHLSGTGIGDLGDINLMPATKEVKLARGNAEDSESGIYSLFDRKSEIAKAGYYAVHLDRYGVDVELTTTKRVGFHRYTFPESENSRVIIDLENGQCWDEPVETYLIQESDSTISGYRYSKGWADDQRVFFTAVFSKKIEGLILSSEKGVAENSKELKAKAVYGQALFSTADKEKLLVKVALSPVSIENAKENMSAELPHWDFEKSVADADRAWNEELSKVRIDADKETKRVFYTAMYHTMIAPSLFCDVNGDYRGADGKMHKSSGFKNYTTLSLWDTYRAAHPLMTIIHPEKVNDIINTMITIYEQQGKLPVWHLMGCETDCMVGNPAIPVVADAILKGYDGFDWNKAYEAMKNSAMLDERDLDLYRRYDFIPFDKETSPEGLSKAMEYAIADWALAQVAQKMGKQEDYEYFLNRSKTYNYYFDPSVNFVRGKSSDGKWRTPFDPFISTHRSNDYTEGNAWQYTWLVPHDVQGLAEQFGSIDSFVEKLDSLFVVEGDLGEEASPDISGLIGNYSHGNEPVHHVLYMYPYVGQPWKTADKVRKVLITLYNDTPEGLPGNEDVGQMSAWYVLSAMGFYQVEPAGGKYVFGTPFVDRAVVKVGDGKVFTVIARNNSAENKYIQSVTLNGKPHKEFYINFADITAGGTLEFTMGATPSESWGTSVEIPK